MSAASSGSNKPQTLGAKVPACPPETEGTLFLWPPSCLFCHLHHLATAHALHLLHYLKQIFSRRKFLLCLPPLPLCSQATPLHALPFVLHPFYSPTTLHSSCATVSFFTGSIGTEEPLCFLQTEIKRSKSPVFVCPPPLCLHHLLFLCFFLSTMGFYTAPASYLT